jgi:hypothetical protein
MREKSPAALAAFEKHCVEFPEDSLAQYHVERLREGENGDVFAMAEK